MIEHTFNIKTLPFPSSMMQRFDEDSFSKEIIEDGDDLLENDTYVERYETQECARIHDTLTALAGYLGRSAATRDWAAKMTTHEDISPNQKIENIQQSNLYDQFNRKGDCND